MRIKNVLLQGCFRNDSVFRCFVFWWEPAYFDYKRINEPKKILLMKTCTKRWLCTALGCWVFLWSQNANALIQAPVQVAEADSRHELPFQESFSYASKGDFDQVWTIYNPDESLLSKWVYMKGMNDLNGDSQSGCVSVMGNPDGASSEYLMLTEPLSLPAGEISVSFWYKTGADTPVESMDILLGTSKDYTQMEIVGEIRNAGSTVYRNHIINYSVPEAGDYYLCFHYNTSSDGYFFYLDEISVNQGSMETSPDLAIRNVEMPLSSCALSAETEISVNVHNEGTAALERFTLTATDAEQNQLASETFETPLGVDQGTTVTFSQKFDFSAVRDYQITVTGQLDESVDEENLENNTYTGHTRNILPVDSYPYECTDFMSEWEPEDPAGWQDEEDYWFVVRSDMPLVSDCFTLQKGHTYRISLDYSAGSSSIGGILYASFYLACGESGTDISSWEVIGRFDEIYKKEKGWEYITWIASEDMDYQFALVATNPQSTRFYGFKIEELSGTKVTLHQCNSSLYAQMPVEQLNSDKHYVAFVLENEGAQDAKTDLQVWDGEKLLAEELVEIPVGVRDTFRVAVPLSDYQVGDVLDLKFQAHTEGDADESDNERQTQTLVTEYVMAIDIFEGDPKEESCVGGLMSLGMLYEVVETDTLTGISAAFYEMNSPYQITLDVYSVEKGGNRLSEKLYHTKATRRTESGWYEYQTPALVLEPGRYMLFVTQIDYNFLRIQTDQKQQGCMYLFSGMEFEPYTEMGNLCLRPLFRNAHPQAGKDAMVYEFVKPSRAEGVLTENELVRVNVQNHGTDTIHSLPVYCQVGDQVMEQMVEQLDPGAYTWVDFRMDLSAAGEHVIEVYTALEEDGNPANDRKTQTINCLDVDIDPYVMNFEWCEDFAVDNFVPGWTSLDLDQTHPYVLLGQDVSFPNDGTSFGFMAFNPAKVNPSIADMEEFKPIKGERYGIAFSSVSVPNDDWLVSPKLLLPKKDASVSYYIRSFIAEAPESYELLVSTTGTDPEDFTSVVGVMEAPAEWTQETIYLSEYAGQEVYIAFRCVSEAKKMLLIDEIEVTKPGGVGLDADSSASLRLYPNPVSDRLYIDASGYGCQSVTIWDVAGNPVYVSDHASDTYRISVDQWPDGVYLVNLQSEKDSWVLKLVVRH